MYRSKIIMGATAFVALVVALARGIIARISPDTDTGTTADTGTTGSVPASERKLHDLLALAGTASVAYPGYRTGVFIDPDAKKMFGVRLLAVGQFVPGGPAYYYVEPLRRREGEGEGEGEPFFARVDPDAARFAAAGDRGVVVDVA